MRRYSWATKLCGIRRDETLYSSELRQTGASLLATATEKRNEIAHKYAQAHFDDALAIVAFNVVGYRDEADLVERRGGTRCGAERPLFGSALPRAWWWWLRS